MKKQRLTKKPQLEFFARSNQDGAFVIDNEFNKMKFKDFLKKRKGEYFKVELFEKSKPKSLEILGFLWGALYPLYILHGKNIKWSDDVDFVKDCYKKGLLTSEEIDDTHATFMTEFRPQMTFDLRTKKPTKQRGELSKMNQRETMLYVAEVCDYLLENVGFLPETETYKLVRDKSKLIREEGLQAIDGVEYPTDYDTSTPTAF